MRKDTIQVIFFVGLFFAVLLACAAFAYDECGTAIPEDTTCSLITPYISYCSSYTIDIYYSNGTSHVSSGTISQIGSTGIYNYTAVFNISDTYVIKLCDDSVRSLNVFNTSATAPSASFWSYLLQIYYNTLPGAW